MEQSVARKQLSRVVVEGKETVVNEYKEFSFDKAIYAEMLNEFDDEEMAANNGVYGSVDDDISIIDVSKVCQYLSDQISDAEVDKETETYRYERWKQIYDYLKPWKGFEIIL